ncbi:hypothetical protein ATCC90586_010874 [Pythium insidiosum]|nr:hypothetical protein ATCC90586_010874 [Pythium insidiosum]
MVASRRGVMWRLLAIASLVMSLALRPALGQSATASAARCGPRVRKPWGAMTPTEQRLYADAVAMGMERGFHAMFTEVHSDVASATEHYKTCGFLYWNRRFLLAYENMLRSLSPRFACVTIPYWNYFSDYARYMAGGCTSLQTCSSILSGLGGSIGAARRVMINGRGVAGNCAFATPVNSFCESSTILWAQSCVRCMPRDDWTKKQLPSGLGYAGLGVLLGRSNGFREFSNNLQYGVHNSIHNTLASTMATYVASADPVYFSHHATIDLLHQIYLECQLGPSVRNTKLLVSRFAFQTCSWSGQEVCPTVTSNFTQLWAVANAKTPPVPADAQPSLAPFFSTLPTEYWQFVTIKDLGNHSYDYQKDDLMTNLEANGYTPTPPPAPAPDQPPAPPVEPPADDSQMMPATSGFSISSGGPAWERLQRERHEVQRNAIQYLRAAIDGALAVDGSVATAFEQVELMECLFHHESLGGVDDYSDFFRDNFPVAPHAHTRCFHLLEALRLGDVTLLVTDWRQYYRNYFSIRAITSSSSSVTTPAPPSGESTSDNNTPST